MEPCVNENEELHCYRPPPVFSVPEPSWFYTTTELPTTDESTTTITEKISTLVSTAISSTISLTTGTTRQEPFVTTESPTEPEQTPSITTEEPEEGGEGGVPPVVIIILVVAIVFLIIVLFILFILCWRKKKAERKHANECTTTFDSQRSTIDLIGKEKPDGNGKETFSYRNEGNHSTENEQSKDGNSVQAKTAPIILMTEL